MTHPSVYSFVFILICLQMLQPSGAGNRWNNVPHHTIKPAVQALQCLVCSLRLRQLLSVPFPGHLPKRGKGARSVSSQETFP